jgi:hypothetical protein
MTDYTKSTNFATKDNLSSGNPLKIVKGTEIDTEFNNIATAVATKADLASPTFTGSPVLPTGTTATTQSSSDDTTKLATTAFVQDVADVVKSALFPVGAIYTATVSTNPATLLGFGTWTAFGAGRVLIGNGGGFSAGATVGSADAIVVSHTHTASTSITDPGHFHTTAVNYAGGTTANGMFSNSNPSNPFSTNSATTGITASTSVTSSGVSGTNANLQPYIVVYMWQRTA